MLEMSPRSFTREDSMSFTLRDLAAPLFRRKRVLIGAFLFIFTVAALLGLLRLHKYESHMSILVSRERLDPLVSTEATNQMGNTPALTDQEVNSEAELLKSRDVLKSGSCQPHAERTWRSVTQLLRPRQTEADRVARAVRALATQIQVDTPSKTNLIEVTYSSPDPAQAYGVLNSLSNLYLEKHAAVHRPARLIPVFSAASGELQNGSAGSEDAAARISVKRRMFLTRTTSAQTWLAINRRHGPVAHYEQTIAADEQQIRSIQEQMKVTPAEIGDQTGYAGRQFLLQNLGTSLLAAETKRTQLLLKYDPSYPLVQEADQEVAQAKAAIAEAEKTPYVNQTRIEIRPLNYCERIRPKIEADLAGQRASLVANQRGIEKHESPRWSNWVASLWNRPTWSARLRRTSRTICSISLNGSRNALPTHLTGRASRTLPSPYRPRSPCCRRTARCSSFWLPLHGGDFSLPTAYIINYFDPSFHTAAQVIHILGIPVVVAMPKRTA